MTWIMPVMKTGKKGERYDLKILVILFNKRKGAETYIKLLQNKNHKYQIWYLFHLGICIFLCKIHSVVIHKSCLRFYKGTKNHNSWCRFQLPFKNFSFTLDLSEAEELLLLSLISFTLLPDIRESNVDLTSLLRFCKKIKTRK